MGSTKVEGREFTPIEKKIINKVVNMSFESMEKAWAEIFPIKTSFIRSEQNPLGVNIVHPTEYLISVKLEVEVNKPAGHIILCMPYASIQPIRDKLSGGYQDEEEDLDKSWVALIKEHLKGVEVDMTVELGETSLAVRDFLNMQEGDILVLKNGVSSKLVARIEGIPKFLGRPGSHNKKKVYKIEEQFEH